MIENVGIFYFSSIPYNFIKQRPQQLYDEWNKNFESYEFFYIEPVDINSYLIKKIFKNFGNPKASLNIVSVPLLKKNQLINKLLGIQKTAEEYFKVGNKLNKKVAIICSPIWEPFISKENFDILCYDYLDSIKVHSNDKNYNKIKLEHKKLILKSDIVFTTAKKLEEDILSVSPQKEIINISNGVNPDFFDKMKDLKIKDYKKTKKVVGYVGAIFNWFDINLVYKAAKLLPNVDFILVGPTKNQNIKLKQPKNIFIVGKKPYDEIPSYINLFDVAIIPFKTGKISECTDPIKVYEYFSLGKPVVSTYLKELEKFNDGNMLKLAKTEEEFIESIKFFLSNEDKNWKNKRVDIAFNNAWFNKADLMIKVLEKHLKDI